jgi:hypothetical protein
VYLIFSERNQLRMSLDKAQNELADVRGTNEDPKLERQDEAAQRDSLDRRLEQLLPIYPLLLVLNLRFASSIGLAVCTNLSVLAHKRLNYFSLFWAF